MADARMHRDLILYISHSGDLDGAEKCLIESAIGVWQRVPTVRSRFVVPWRGRLTDELDARGIQYTLEDYKNLMGAPPGTYRSLFASVLRTHRPKLVYVMSAVMSDAVSSASDIGVPCLWHIQEHIGSFVSVYDSVPVEAILETARTSRCKILAASTAAAGMFRGVGDPCVVVHNGVAARPRVSKAHARGILGVERGTRVIVQLGVIDARKNHEVTIRALRKVPVKRVSAHFIGDGDEELRRRLQKEAEVSGVGDRIWWHGWQADPYLWLAAADLLTHPSLSEASPRVILEAMRDSCPVVTANWPGAEEVVSDGVTGFVSTGEVGRFAQDIGRVLEGGRLARRMGRCARARWEERFTLERYKTAIASAVVSMLGSDRGR